MTSFRRTYQPGSRSPECISIDSAFVSRNTTISASRRLCVTVANLHRTAAARPPPWVPVEVDRWSSVRSDDVVLEWSSMLPESLASLETDDTGILPCQSSQSRVDARIVWTLRSSFIHPSVANSSGLIWCERSEFRWRLQRRPRLLHLWMWSSSESESSRHSDVISRCLL